jgi:dolichol kinase
MSNGLTKEEINRKLLHVLAVSLPVAIFFGPGFFGVERIWACILALGLTIFSFFVEFARLNRGSFGEWFLHYFGSLLRKEEKHQVTGGSYLMAGAASCSLISLHSEAAAACAFLGLTLFILGDAAAALVGKSIGRIKVGGKTLEGSLGCCLVCVLLAFFVFPSLPGFLDDWGGELSLVQVLALSVTVSLLELVPIRLGGVVINDNLYVPAVTSAIALMIR